MKAQDTIEVRTKRIWGVKKRLQDDRLMFQGNRVQVQGDLEHPSGKFRDHKNTELIIKLVPPHCVTYLIVSSLPLQVF